MTAARRQPLERVVLIGCVAQKLDHAAPARELYTSPLFAKRRAYAEAAGCPWGIVSAQYGLVWPDRVIEPYDATIDDLAEIFLRPQRMAESMWASRVACELRHRLGWELNHDVHDLTIELHAGARYVGALRRNLTDRVFGWQLDLPVAGLGIGEQLAWYRALSESRAREPEAASPLKEKASSDA